MQITSSRILGIVSTYICFSIVAINSANASEHLGKGTYTPEPGVICDTYACANGTDGLSATLTAKYIGKAAAENVIRMVKDPYTTILSFTFMDGVDCEIKDRLCYVDRYFNADGSHDKVAKRHTAALFLPIKTK